MPCRPPGASSALPGAPGASWGVSWGLLGDLLEHPGLLGVLLEAFWDVLGQKTRSRLIWLRTLAKNDECFSFWWPKALKTFIFTYQNGFLEAQNLRPTKDPKRGRPTVTPESQHVFAPKHCKLQYDRDPVKMCPPKAKAYS